MSDIENEDSNSGNGVVPTHARVKYLEDNTQSIIQVKSIVEFKHHQPRNVNDFERENIYSTIYQDERNPNGIIQPIMISDLAVAKSSEDLLDIEHLFKGRSKFPKLDRTKLDEFYDKHDSDADFENEDEDKIEESESDSIEESENKYSKGMKKKEKNSKSHKKIVQKLFKEQQRDICKDIMEKKLKTLDSVASLTFHSNTDERDEKERKTIHNVDANQIEFKEIVCQGKASDCMLQTDVTELKNALENKNVELNKKCLTLEETVQKDAILISKLQIEIHKLKDALQKKDQELAEKQIILNNNIDELNKLKMEHKQCIVNINSSTHKERIIEKSSVRKQLFSLELEKPTNPGKINNSSTERLTAASDCTITNDVDENSEQLFSLTIRRNEPPDIKIESAPLSQNDIFEENSDALDFQFDNNAGDDTEMEQQSPSLLNNHRKKHKGVIIPLAASTPIPASKSTVPRQYLNEKIESIHNIEVEDDSTPKSPTLNKGSKKRELARLTDNISLPKILPKRSKKSITKKKV